MFQKELILKKQTHEKSTKFCHYWYFKNIAYEPEPHLCNGFHGLMQKANNFSDTAIVYVKGNAYRIHFWYMSKDDAINIMNKSTLINKMGLLYKNSFFIYI